MRSRLFAVLLTAAFLCAGLLLFGGCRSNADAAARETIELANSNLENASEEFNKMEELKTKSAKLVKQDADTLDTASMIAIINSFQKSAETALDEVEEAQSQFKEALDMNISSDMKKYLKMKLNALDYQVSMLNKLHEEQELRVELFKAQQQGISMDQVYEYAKRIAELDKEASSIAEKAKAGLRDANEFYKEKNLDK